MRTPLAILMLLICLVMSLSTSVLAERQLGERVLSYGSWGADVFRLQQYLIRAGYDLAADGHFGSQTKNVVTAFQLAHGLTPDGVVGLKTLDVIVSASGRETTTYVVQPGDSLWKIARDFNTTMEALIEMNNLPDGPLRIGQQMRVPAQTTYTVQPGDTLSAIAVRFQTTVKALAERNGIANPSIIRVGTELRIP